MYVRRVLLGLMAAITLAIASVVPAQASGVSQPMPSGWSSLNPTAGWAVGWAKNASTLAYSGYTDAVRARTIWGQSACVGSGYNCTQYAAYRLSTNGAINFVQGCATGSNAESWDERARKCGLAVNGTPAPGAIIQWDADAYGGSGVGHVAYVDAVFGDVLLVSEAGCSGGAAREVLSLAGLNARGLVSQGKIEFIHALDLPNPGADSGPVPVLSSAPFEASSNNGWVNQPRGSVAGATDVASMTMDGVKYIYTINDGRVYEAASNNGWRSNDVGSISGATDIAVTNLNGVKYIYTLINGVAYEAASSNGWTNLPLGTVSGARGIAALAANGEKFVYTLINGSVYEAASGNGWANLPLGTVAGASNVAATSVGGQKFVYTLINGSVYEAASGNGWANLPLGTVAGASDIAATSVGGDKFVYTLINGSAYEAASSNGWVNLPTVGVSGVSRISATSLGSEKLIYSTN